MRDKELEIDVQVWNLLTRLTEFEGLVFLFIEKIAKGEINTKKIKEIFEENKEKKLEEIIKKIINDSNFTIIKK